MGLDIIHYYATNNRGEEKNTVICLEEIREDEEYFEKTKGTFDRVSSVYAKFIYASDIGQVFEAKIVSEAGKIMKDDFYDQFPPNCFVVSINELLVLRNFCKEEYLGYFDRKFVHTWCESISILEISW